jgi:sortase A
LSRFIGKAVHLLALGCTSLGLVCLAVFLVATLDARHAAWAAESAFEQLYREVLTDVPDQQDWSEGRKREYIESRAAEIGAPSGLIKIPSLELTVPIFRGTSDLVLNRGAGWIEGTAELGSSGNVGVAAHRDGFFRGLKDIKEGDAIEIATIDGSMRYQVNEIMIVDPEDVHVLEPTSDPAITLVTCYPFYFVGSAPQRYIVRGVLEEG